MSFLLVQSIDFVVSSRRRRVIEKIKDKRERERNKNGYDWTMKSSNKNVSKYVPTDVYRKVKDQVKELRPVMMTKERERQDKNIICFSL